VAGNSIFLKFFLTEITEILALILYLHIRSLKMNNALRKKASILVKILTVLILLILEILFILKKPQDIPIDEMRKNRLKADKEAYVLELKMKGVEK
jgi:formate-dependent nitrite reductase membrane component NrfD